MRKRTSTKAKLRKNEYYIGGSLPDRVTVDNLAYVKRIQKRIKSRKNAKK